VAVAQLLAQLPGSTAVGCVLQQHYVAVGLEQGFDRALPAAVGYLDNVGQHLVADAGFVQRGAEVAHVFRRARLAAFQRGQLGAVAVAFDLLRFQRVTQALVGVAQCG